MQLLTFILIINMKSSYLLVVLLIAVVTAKITPLEAGSVTIDDETIRKNVCIFRTV